MTTIGISPSTALFCNLDDSLSGELRSALHESLDINATCCSTPGECIEQAHNSAAEVIFCPFSTQLIELLSALDSDRRRIPVVVVTRHPEAREWIDSIEAGASDYCSAPFESRQLRWILSANRQ